MESADLFALFDYGSVADEKTRQNLPESATLNSTGLGLSYGIDRYLDLTADYGWQLAVPPGASSRSGIANIAVTLAY